MSVLIDFRCPCRNAPVKGREEVAWRKQLPKVKECPHCHTAVKLEKQQEGDELLNQVRELGGEMYYFATGEQPRHGDQEPAL